MIAEKIYKEILNNISNVYDDNYDYHRYGKMSLKSRLGLIVLKLCKRFGLIYFPVGKYSFQSRMNKLYEKMEGLDFLYERLQDQRSKDLLVQLMTFRVLGNFRFKIKLDKPDYFNSVDLINSLKSDNESVEALGAVNKLVMNKYDLSQLGYNLKIFLHQKGLVSDFVWKQYEYQGADFLISAKPGDTVIDAGGCYGDTALYFAAQVGDMGKVFTFEFIPNNIELFNKNVQLNTSVTNTIELIKRPLWNKADVTVYYQDMGSGSKVSFDKLENSEQVFTTTIDALVADKKLTAVDFIKMDIEGAELNALEGAATTITQFKPTLAISVYHSLGDFGDIPKRILDINPNYKLYLGHYTIHAEETILFAIDPTK